MSDATSRPGNQTAGEQTSGAEPIDLVALATGRMIGRYEVVSVLGQGGFGITYRARDAQLGREVAIKEYLPLALAVRQAGITVLPRSTTAAQDFAWGRDRFVAEGRTLASLQNAPGIVRVFDFLEANGTAYIVMQLVQGETLENRMKSAGNMGPADIDRILWPLLDGLEQVHNAGFLHRDIKPANILLDAAGNPTLIDFGASRAAMADRSTALTAVFTPGYAAGEQMTSAKQGPWTDIYGLSATLYHAITGRVPPSAFDRMLDDAYEPLGKMTLPGFARGLLAGLDAGLAVRASDRPQTIAGWRPILGQVASPDAAVTTAMVQPAPARPTITPAATQSAPPPKKRGVGLWLGAAAAVIVLLGGGGYYAFMDNKQRVEAEQRQKAEQEAAQRKQIEEETRRKVEAEAAAQRQAEEAARKAAEAAELALKLTLLDRQHVQVALGALGYNAGNTDGNLRSRATREAMIAWQKSRNEPATGHLTGLQNQALLRDAAPAIASFDAEQKKAEDARRKAEEDKAKAEAAARTPPPPAAAPAPAAPAPATPAPAVAAVTPRSGPDGHWSGNYHCTAARNGAAEFTARIQFNISGGTGTWTRPGSGPGTMGLQSITFTVSGAQVSVTRLHVPNNSNGAVVTSTMAARFEGNSISGSGPERNSGGRTCEIAFVRAQ
jgi:serine/threonine protein kinase/peptidoglycan hydrolase-like protein with peptidoglycan-binding domain